MNNLEHKTLCFLTGLSNVYRDEEDVEYSGKIAMTEEGLTEDFTAMLIAMSMFYAEITGEDTDLVRFTHVLNSLAVQHIVENQDMQKEEEE